MSVPHRLQMKYPGMYPKIGGIIASNGPYKTVKAVYSLDKLSSSQKETVKKYESNFVATAANPLLDPMRGRDPYRAQYNEDVQVRD